MPDQPASRSKGGRPPIGADVRGLAAFLDDVTRAAAPPSGKFLDTAGERFVFETIVEALRWLDAPDRKGEVDRDASTAGGRAAKFLFDIADDGSGHFGELTRQHQQNLDRHNKYGSAITNRLGHIRRRILALLNDMPAPAPIVDPATAGLATPASSTSGARLRAELTEGDAAATSGE